MSTAQRAARAFTERPRRDGSEPPPMVIFLSVALRCCGGGAACTEP